MYNRKMEPTIPNITPVSIPVPEVSTKKFKKSTFIIVLAVPQLFLSLPGFFNILRGNFISLIMLIFLIPAIIVIFTKKEQLYKIARGFLIVEFIFELIFFAVYLFEFLMWN